MMRCMKKQFYNTHDAIDEESESLYDGPSKSQKKRDAEALQALGKELSELSSEQRSQIELPENLSEAIDDLAKMKSFGARRRQLQLIGKLMRAMDAASVREAIDRATSKSKAAVAAQHRAEKARDAMIATDAALTEFVEKHPDVDVQKLRQLVRAARKEASLSKPPKSARELYRLLYALFLPTLNLLAKDEENSDS